MSPLRLLDSISVEDYLEAEKRSPIKHEYIHGRVFALAGTSNTHNRIAGNIFAQLWPAAADKGCAI